MSFGQLIENYILFIEKSIDDYRAVKKDDFVESTELTEILTLPKNDLVNLVIELITIEKGSFWRHESCIALFQYLIAGKTAFTTLDLAKVLNVVSDPFSSRYIGFLIKRIEKEVSKTGWTAESYHAFETIAAKDEYCADIKRDGHYKGLPIVQAHKSLHSLLAIMVQYENIQDLTPYYFWIRQDGMGKELGKIFARFDKDEQQAWFRLFALIYDSKLLKGKKRETVQQAIDEIGHDRFIEIWKDIYAKMMQIDISTNDAVEKSVKDSSHLLNGLFFSLSALDVEAFEADFVYFIEKIVIYGFQGVPSGSVYMAGLNILALDKSNKPIIKGLKQHTENKSYLKLIDKALL